MPINKLEELKCLIHFTDNDSVTEKHLPKNRTNGAIRYIIWIHFKLCRNKADVTPHATGTNSKQVILLDVCVGLSLKPYAIRCTIIITFVI
nr:unnamed protein product [Callosobruchus analis]